jgi:hypothetical protein
MRRTPEIVKYREAFEKAGKPIPKLWHVLSRSERRNLCFKIALEHTPLDVKYVGIRNKRIRREDGAMCRGMADTAEGYILSPKPNTSRRLWVFIHECAHMLMHRNMKSRFAPRHMTEFEAEEYTAKVFADNGIPERYDWKEVILYMLRDDIEEGLKPDCSTCRKLGVTRDRLVEIGAEDWQLEDFDAEMEKIAA